MALNDAEQRELLEGVRAIVKQLVRGLSSGRTQRVRI